MKAARLKLLRQAKQSQHFRLLSIDWLFGNQLS
jgi:hypothetical protein